VRSSILLREGLFFLGDNILTIRAITIPLMPPLQVSPSVVREKQQQAKRQPSCLFARMAGRLV